jgi:hypothetical protein
MKTWLFRPFTRIAGGPALTAGLVVVIITAGLATAGGMVTDGVLDLHFAEGIAFWQNLAMGLLNWLILAGVLLIIGRMVSKTRFRVIDLFGTQALARWPLLLGVAYMSIPWVNRTIEELTINMLAAMPTDPSKVMSSTAYLADAMWLTLLAIPSLLGLAWMIWLMFHGYALTCNLKGQRAFFSFVGALIIAEILSKVVVLGLY